MGLKQKYQVTKWSSIVGIPVTLWFLGKIKSYALGGNDTRAKQWFVAMTIFVSVELAVTVMHYYYRNKLRQPIESDQIAVETLAKLKPDDVASTQITRKHE